MLTARGWWILWAVLGLLFGGLLTGTPPLVVICLTLLSWILGSWLIFVVKMRLVQGRLRLERELRSERGPLQVLWVGQRVRVVAKLVTDSRLSLSCVWIVDRLPALGRLHEGTNKIQGKISRLEPLAVDYTITCPGAGRLRFEGLHVQIADLNGFFQQSLFVRQVFSYRVYPAAIAVQGHSVTGKRHNILPLLGTHRHRRPGSGSELLDVREYLPGDPPKMIAWKASARRDRLMTKEFESEVPVRCTLFVDVSSSVCIGRPGENVLARLIEITAGVMQASAHAKDLTGLCLFDEHKVHRLIRPGRGPRHVQNELRALIEVADLPLTSEHVSLEQLLPLAFGLAQEVYPELLDPAVNAFPAWLPFWAPQPGYTQEIPGRPAGSPLRMPWSWLSYGGRRTLYAVREFLLGRISPRKRRHYRWRKLLSAILAQRFGMGPGGLSLLMEDDSFCRQYVQRFLCEHQVAFPVPLYDSQGKYLLAAPEKIDRLAQALLASVARGRDNELFVLLVDVLEIGPHLHRLLRAVQVARARHHRVLLICPWSKEVPLPDRANDQTQTDADRRQQQRRQRCRNCSSRPARTACDLAALHVQQTFARLGVPVLFSPEEESVALILHHMQQLRLLEAGGRDNHFERLRTNNAMLSPSGEANSLGRSLPNTFRQMAQLIPFKLVDPLQGRVLLNAAQDLDIQYLRLGGRVQQDLETSIFQLDVVIAFNNGFVSLEDEIEFEITVVFAVEDQFRDSPRSGELGKFLFLFSTATAAKDEECCQTATEFRYHRDLLVFKKN